MEHVQFLLTIAVIYTVGYFVLVKAHSALKLGMGLFWTFTTIMLVVQLIDEWL